MMMTVLENPLLCARAAALLVDRHVIMVRNESKLAFHPEFLARMSNEAINILNLNAKDQLFVNDLRADKKKLVRLATNNVISEMFSDQVSLEVITIILKTLDSMIVRALSVTTQLE